MKTGCFITEGLILTPNYCETAGNGDKTLAGSTAKKMRELESSVRDATALHAVLLRLFMTWQSEDGSGGEGGRLLHINMTRTSRGVRGRGNPGTWAGSWAGSWCSADPQACPPSRHSLCLSQKLYGIRAPVRPSTRSPADPGQVHEGSQ